MKLYGLKNCDTCRRALKELRAAGHDVVLADLRNDGIDPKELERLFLVFGQPLVNRRSTTWRGLSEAIRDGEPVALMLEYPSLMKRPVIVDGGGSETLGWGEVEKNHWGIKNA